MTTRQTLRMVSQLLAIAEYITKTHAIGRSAARANHNQGTIESGERVAAGGAGMYEAYCSAA